MDAVGWLLLGSTIYLFAQFVPHSPIDADAQPINTVDYAIFNTNQPSVAPGANVQLQADTNGNLRTIVMGTTPYYPSPSANLANALPPAGVINPSAYCRHFVGSTTTNNLFALWGVGPPGQYIDIIDGASAPPTGTPLVAEPPTSGSFGYIGGGQINGSGQWSYTTQAPFPEVPTFGIEVCVSSTPPALYTAYTGSATVIVTASMK